MTTDAIEPAPSLSIHNTAPSWLLSFSPPDGSPVGWDVNAWTLRVDTAGLIRINGDETREPTDAEIGATMREWARTWSADQRRMREAMLASAIADVERDMAAVHEENLAAAYHGEELAEVNR